MHFALLTVSQCDDILNEDRRTYLKEDIELIRELLYQFAIIEYDYFLNVKNAENILPIFSES